MDTALRVCVCVLVGVVSFWQWLSAYGWVDLNDITDWLLNAHGDKGCLIPVVLSYHIALDSYLYVVLDFHARMSSGCFNALVLSACSASDHSAATSSAWFSPPLSAPSVPESGARVSGTAAAQMASQAG